MVVVVVVVWNTHSDLLLEILLGLTVNDSFFSHGKVYPSWASTSLKFPIFDLSFCPCICIILSFTHWQWTWSSWALAKNWKTSNKKIPWKWYMHQHGWISQIFCGVFCGKKPDTKELMLRDSIYMKFKSSRINRWWQKAEEWLPLAGWLHTGKEHREPYGVLKIISWFGWVWCGFYIHKKSWNWNQWVSFWGALRSSGPLCLSTVRIQREAKW